MKNKIKKVTECEIIEVLEAYFFQMSGYESSKDIRAFINRIKANGIKKRDKK